MAVAALAGLTACGSDGSEQSEAVVEDRQAFMENRAVEICVGDGTFQFEMTLKFDSNLDANGRGPFPLHGGWCGTDWPDVAGSVYDTEGSRIMWIVAGNPLIGTPYVGVTCRPDSRSDPRYVSTSHRFDEGGTFSFPCDPYTVDVVRERDSSVKKHFSVTVNPR